MKILVFTSFVGTTSMSAKGERLEPSQVIPGHMHSLLDFQEYVGAFHTLDSLLSRFHFQIFVCNLLLGTTGVTVSGSCNVKQLPLTGFHNTLM